MRIIVVSFCVLPWVALAQPIVSSGTIEIPGTYTFSFDGGALTKADIVFPQWHLPTRRIVAWFGAEIFNLGSVSFVELGPSKLLELTYGKDQIKERKGGLEVGDVFAVHTNSGNHSKVLVKSVPTPPETERFSIEWVTYSPSSSIKIVSSGTVDLAEGGDICLDTGMGSDVFWLQVTPSERYLVNHGAARIANLGHIDFATLTLAELQRTDYGGRISRVDGSDQKNVLTPGDVFAVLTNRGNYAKARVIAELDPAKNHGLLIEWVTYASK